MRKALVLGLSTLVLAGGIVPSEARFRFRGGGYSASRYTPSVSPGLAVMPGITLRSGGTVYPSPSRAGAMPVGAMSADALPTTEERTVTIAQPLPAPAPVAPAPKKDSGPWCASGRIAGSGAGFCLIN